MTDARQASLIGGGLRSIYIFLFIYIFFKITEEMRLINVYIKLKFNYHATFALFVFDPMAGLKPGVHSPEMSDLDFNELNTLWC